jgi:hypothetical protein
MRSWYLIIFKQSLHIIKFPLQVFKTCSLLTSSHIKIVLDLLIVLNLFIDVCHLLLPSSHLRFATLLNRVEIVSSLCLSLIKISVCVHQVIIQMS